MAGISLSFSSGKDTSPTGLPGCPAPSTRVQDQSSCETSFCAHLCTYGERADLRLMDRPMGILNGAEALIIIGIEWQVFRSQSFETVKDLLKHPVIFNGHNL